MDLDLESLGVYSASQTETDIVKYFINQTYSDVLDLKNNKFPGTMVASLSRNDLETIRGISMLHFPYKKEEIVAWINPIKRQIPVISFKSEVKNKSWKNESTTKRKKTIFESDSLDFGDASGLFFFNDLKFYSLEELDFGSNSGLFEFF
jgi:hypothetical protein